MAARAVSFLASLFIVALLCASAQAQSVQCAQTPAAGTSNITCANTAFVQNQFAKNFSPPNVQSGDYTIAPTDCPKNGAGEILETGAFKKITLPAPAGFAEGCIVRIKNASTTRGQKMVGFPADLTSSGTNACGVSNFCLWPLQTVVVQIQNSAWGTLQNPGRSTFIVPVYSDSSLGSDNNDCLAAGAAACATLNQAYAISCFLFDPGNNATQTFNNGTFSNFLTGGCGVPRLIQVNGNPSATVNDGGVPGFSFTCDDVCEIQLGASGSITLAATGSASQNLLGQRGSILDVSNTTFTSSAGANGILVHAENGAKIDLNSSNTFAGGGGGGTTIANVVLVNQGGKIVTGATQTVSGTFAVTNGCFASTTGVIDLTNGGFSGGTVTGSRWASNTAGGVSGTPNTNCPGNVNGTATAPGWSQ